MLFIPFRNRRLIMIRALKMLGDQLITNNIYPIVFSALTLHSFLYVFLDSLIVILIDAMSTLHWEYRINIAVLVVFFHILSF